MINWEEFGRSQLARTVLNLSQLSRREASDLAFHRKAVARKMTGPIHTEEVTGSIPVSPTRSEAMWISVKITMGSHSCSAAYTVAQAIKDWLADALDGRAPKTVSTQREVLEPLIDIIGAVPLRELSAATVRSALKSWRPPAGQEGRPSKSLTFGKPLP